MIEAGMKVRWLTGAFAVGALGGVWFAPDAYQALGWSPQFRFGEPESVRAAREAEEARVAWVRRAAELRSQCGEIVAAAEVRAKEWLSVRAEGEGSYWQRERVEVFMDRRGEPAVRGEVRAGSPYGRNQARFVLASDRMRAAYLVFADAETSDLWRRVSEAQGYESLCVLYN